MQAYADNLIRTAQPFPLGGDRWEESQHVDPLGPGRLALGLAFFTLGMQFCLPRLFIFLQLPWIPFLDLALCLPATLLGVRSWLRARSFATSWPVVVCALMVWASLIYAEESQSKRPFYFAALLTTTLPVGALIAHQRAWAFCAKAFVVGATAATLIVAWLQLIVERGWMNIATIRFGLYDHRSWGERATDPNEVGFILALATVLALILYLQSGAADQDSSRCRRGRLGLGWTAIVTAGCLLTVSRGAIVALAAGLGILLLRGISSRHVGRVRDLVLAAVLGTSLVILLAVASGHAPWEGVKNRFVGDKTVTTLGDRVDIWRNVYRALSSKSKYLLFGAGTGMASQVLGRFDVGATEDNYGQLHRNCHNTYLDWTLTYGLVGLAAGACLVLVVGHRAVKLDRRSGGAARVSFLVTIGLLGMTGVVYQQVPWLAIGSLVLAMLSDASLFGDARPLVPAQSRSPFDLPAALPSRRPTRTATVPCSSPTTRCSLEAARSRT